MRCSPAHREPKWEEEVCWEQASERGVDVERAHDGLVPEVGKDASGGAERVAVGIRIGSGILLACALYAAFRLPIPAGRLASLSSQGAARIATAGVGEAVKGGWMGLWAGTLHTLCGPDHLAGLTPLSLGQNQTIAAAMGALWGFGHSSGQLILGLVFILLKERFHGIVPILSKWSGAIVGLTLIGIGVLGVYESLVLNEEPLPVESVAMAGVDGRVQAETGGVVETRRHLGTYLMGFVYGLQPDSLFVVLPALALPSRIGAIMYVSMFVIGTVAAMGGYTLAIGTASEAAAKQRPSLLRQLSTMAGGLAILIGIVVLVSGLGLRLSI